MSTRKTMPTTYGGLLNYLGDRSRRVLCHNTAVELHRGFVAITLHGHRICELYPDGTVFVDDCGYTTTTTYDRIKRFLPQGWKVQRRYGVGYLIPPAWATVPTVRRIPILRYGVLVYSDGHASCPTTGILNNRQP